ncbi:MAG: hypothetical protein KAH35_02215 [Candidatus Atribacteria bacterium]|nr:hypothetical protein [Candidatus Atribacteria bacterium]
MKLKTSDIEKAIALALKVHTGQKDKAGAPYILHPLRVMLSMDTDIERQAAAFVRNIQYPYLEFLRLFSIFYASSVWFSSSFYHSLLMGKKTECLFWWA